MEAKIVRGYKLKLWKERLKLAPEFVDMVDNMGLNYVTLEIPMEDDSQQIILLTKVKGSLNPIPISINMPNDIVEAIVERIETNA